jgi:adenylate cyclase
LASVARFFTAGPGRALLLTAAALAVVVPLSLLPLGQTLENQALDLCYRLRPAAPPPSEILIVGIDEASFQELRRPWPWPRRLHAQLIRKLAQAGACLIVFDILFAEPTTPEDDCDLVAAIHQAGNVIVAQAIETVEDPRSSRQILVQPLEAFSKPAFSTALFMVTPDADGVVRRFRPHLGGLETMPAQVFHSVRPQDSIPENFTGLIHYVGPPGSLETVSYYQLLDSEKPFPAERIRNRIVLIGRVLGTTIDPRVKADVFFTPFFAGTRQAMPGIELQGHILATLLAGNWGTELPWAGQLVLCFSLILAMSFLVVRLKPLWGLAVLGTALGVILGLSWYLFLWKDYWVPPALLGLGLSLVYGGHVLEYSWKEIREKRWLRQAFGRYVSPAVVEAIAARPEQLQLGGEETEVTVLFADMAGFTALSEEMAPGDLIDLLEEYFETLTQIVLARKGTVDKYIGDAVMCFWGAPLSIRDHARRACRAALEMQEAFHYLKESWQARGLPAMSLRIGIHSGRVVAGNVGSRERFNYTVMGDAVNLAFRLEKANKTYGSEIILTEATRRLAGEGFLLRELDHILVRGKTRPVIIYELRDYLPPGGLPEEFRLFARGLEDFRRRQWDRAREIFEQLSAMNPDDGAARLYLRRCRAFLKNPPPEDWQGIHVLQ